MEFDATAVTRQKSGETGFCPVPWHLTVNL
jgi:hypothetical protein